MVPGVALAGSVSLFMSMPSGATSLLLGLCGRPTWVCVLRWATQGLFMVARRSVVRLLKSLPSPVTRLNLMHLASGVFITGVRLPPTCRRTTESSGVSALVHRVWVPLPVSVQARLLFG